MCDYEDSNGYCHALACYSLKTPCNARKTDGEPKYCKFDGCTDGRHKWKDKIKDFGEDDD